MYPASRHEQRAVPVRGRTRALALAGFTALALAALSAAILLDGGAASALPALLLPGLLLALRRYPGERVLSVLAQARRRLRRRPTSSRRPLQTATHLLPRGGLLLARSLAVRPPPRHMHAAG